MAAWSAARRQPQPRPGPQAGRPGQPGRAARPPGSRPQRQAPARRSPPDGSLRQAGALPSGRTRRRPGGTRRRLTGHQREPVHDGGSTRAGPRSCPGDAGAGVGRTSRGRGVPAAAVLGPLRQGRGAADRLDRVPPAAIRARPARFVHQCRKVRSGRDRRGVARGSRRAHRPDHRAAPRHQRPGAGAGARDRPGPLVY